MNNKHDGTTVRVSSVARIASLGLVVAIAPAHALDISSGDWYARIDSTVSWGASWRVQERDNSIIGLPNGGTAFSVNGDDGNLNYDQGPISNAVKLTSELLLEKDSYGGFFRFSAFYDFENNDGDRDRTPLSDEAKDIVGSDAEFLDAYVWKRFDVAEKPGEVRFGNQVLSWGESTFIQNSINAINPVDVSKIRIPGAELREALTPVTMLSGSLGVTENGTLEGFVQLGWQETEIDPPGTYFSSNDFVGPGGERVQLGFGGVPEGSFLSVSRAANREADDSGQFGLAYRWYMPDLNDTEFGAYFINYHSRLPIISARTGTQAGVIAAAQNLNTNLATDAYAETARYYIEYPEDIQLLGLSFNTTAGDYALQGEYSFRQDQPLQVDDIELLFAALTPINPALTASQVVGFLNDGAAYATDTDIPGYIKRDVSQLQMTATRLFPRVMGASELTVVAEVGVTHVHDMPAKSELRLEAPGTYISGNQTLASAHGPAAGQFEAAEHFADATSWGYRVVGRLQYNNAIGAVNLLPRIAWAEDVNGNTPGPGGNFLEGRTALTLGLGATYLGNWSGDISYTRYDGADRYNLINDRDFVAFNVKYSF